MARTRFEVLRPSRKQINGLPVSFAIRRINQSHAGIEYCEASRLHLFIRDGITQAVKIRGKRKQRAAAYCPPRSITRWDYT